MYDVQIVLSKMCRCKMFKCRGCRCKMRKCICHVTFFFDKPSAQTLSGRTRCDIIHGEISASSAIVKRSCFMWSPWGSPTGNTHGIHRNSGRNWWKPTPKSCATRGAHSMGHAERDHPAESNSLPVFQAWFPYWIQSGVSQWEAHDRFRSTHLVC